MDGVRTPAAGGTQPAAAILRAVLAIGWLSACALGMGLLERRAATPGPPGREAPASWPEGSALERAADRPTLLLFLHPRCPCSGATVAELGRLLAEIPGRAAVCAVLTVPEGAPDGWAGHALRERVAAIPGVAVAEDRNGAEARRFGAATSGTAILYGPRGELLYRGGITLARGHEGDNPGRDALAGLLAGTGSERSGTPVFGCPLETPPSPAARAAR